MVEYIVRNSALTSTSKEVIASGCSTVEEYIAKLNSSAMSNSGLIDDNSWLLDLGGTGTQFVYWRIYAVANNKYSNISLGEAFSVIPAEDITAPDMTKVNVSALSVAPVVKIGKAELSG